MACAGCQDHGVMHGDYSRCATCSDRPKNNNSTDMDKFERNLFNETRDKLMRIKSPDKYRTYCGLLTKVTKIGNTNLYRLLVHGGRDRDVPIIGTIRCTEEEYQSIKKKFQNNDISFEAEITVTVFNTTMFTNIVIPSIDRIKIISNYEDIIELLEKDQVEGAKITTLWSTCKSNM